MFYTIIALILFCFAVIQYAKKEYKTTRFEVLLLFSGFWLVAGLAYETGVDWMGYSSIFDQTVPITDSFTNKGFLSSVLLFEPGYGIISSLIRSFTKDFQYLQLTLLFIASLFFFKGLKLYTKNYFAVLLLYLGYLYLALNMNIIRQAVALAIVFYALQYIESKSFWKYSLCIVIAATFHISALVMIPLYFIIRLRISPAVVFTILGIGLIFYFLRISLLTNPISWLVNKIITWSENQNTGWLALQNVNSYISRLHLYLSNTKEISSKINLKVIFNVAIIAVFIVRRSILILQNKYFDIFLNMFIIYTIIGLYLWDSGWVFIRLQYYFIVGLIILLPELIASLKRILYRLALLLFTLVLSIWSSNPIFLERPTGVSYNPYQNYIIYKALKKQSTGKQRREEFFKNLKQ